MTAAEEAGEAPLPDGAFVYSAGDLASQGAAGGPQPFEHNGREYRPPGNSHWKANYPDGMRRLAYANRIHVASNTSDTVAALTTSRTVQTNLWTDTGTGNFTDEKIYVVQTSTEVIERCC